MPSKPDSQAVPGLGIAVLLTTLVALGPLSTDFYLPSLPAMTAALGTDVAGTQLTLSIFLGGFAVGQLFYGPLSDRFGRRPLMLIGLGIFLVASIACALAPNIETLIAARFVQAIGACAGPVLGRTVVRDLYGPKDSARMLSYISAAMALAPLLGPVFGGWLSVIFSWRATFVFLVIYSALQTAATWRLLAESNLHPDPTAVQPRRILANYATLLRDTTYRGVLMCNGLAYAGMFAFISGAPFVFINLFGFSPQTMGLAFGLMVSGFITGTMSSGRLASRYGPDSILTAGVVIGSVGGAVMLLFAVTGWQHPVAIMVPMWLVTCGIGFIMPNATAIALAPWPTMAGAAASLMGFSQMALAAAFGIFVGHSFTDSTVPMAAAISAGMGGSLISYLLWVRPGTRGPAG
ncbi:MAG: multidrug effflux MFS transporter [Zoogloeaceae bacterium]|nr:multidrug effflux MFS transporter [Rhodocyclaceae bacterium]MCP5222313.1 multidrug effflux MFS transporter [Zoogloeaceae bacterium]